MSWVRFWRDMNARDKRKFAEDCGSSYESMSSGYVYGDRVPRVEKLALMVVKSNNRLPIDDAIEHFITSKVRREIQRLQKKENPADGV